MPVATLVTSERSGTQRCYHTFSWKEKGIHIIDLNKTQEKMREAAAALESIARSGKKILFVGTKKQAKDTISNIAQAVNMPYVTERWLGGMLTNFSTIRKSIKKMSNIEKMLGDSNASTVLTKKERLTAFARVRQIESRIRGYCSAEQTTGRTFHHRHHS